MKLWKALVASFVVTVAAAPASAASLIVMGGKLTGATGVDVGGTLYDVSFVDGSCASIFDGCDDVSDFTFNSAASAGAAAQALLDQVLIDGPLGLFDSNPALTFGCDSSEQGFCFSFIPYATSTVSTEIGPLGVVTGMGPSNTPLEMTDSVGESSTITAFDFALLPFQNWATFAPAGTAPVPEPATWALMIVGFGAVGGAMRRARRKSLSPATA